MPIDEHIASLKFLFGLCESSYSLGCLRCDKVLGHASEMTFDELLQILRWSQAVSFLLLCLSLCLVCLKVRNRRLCRDS